MANAKQLSGTKQLLGLSRNRPQGQIKTGSKMQLAMLVADASEKRVLRNRISIYYK